MDGDGLIVVDKLALALDMLAEKRAVVVWHSVAGEIGLVDELRSART